jgi:acetyl esterase/lipase
MIHTDQVQEYQNEVVDVYVPDISVTNAPVVFYVHGGAWHLGGKHKAEEPCKALVSKGFVCVATSYRLSNINHQHVEMICLIVAAVMILLLMISTNKVQVVFISSVLVLIVLVCVCTWSYLPADPIQHPTHIHDVAESFKWTVANVHRFGGDPNKIFVMGHSAGGHLATLLSTNTYFLENIQVNPKSIKGCISLSGIYSDKRLKEIPGGNHLLKNTFGDRNHYYDAFPIYNITDATPPTLLINANMELGLKKQTLDYHYALKQSGVYVATAYFEKCYHWDIYYKWGKGQKNEKVLETIVLFMEEVLEV